MKNWTLWSFLLLLAVSPAMNLDSPVITTKTGKVQGTRKTYNGSCVDVYYGIPFATPPVGDLRFKRTVPVEKWDGILNATTKPPACLQAPINVPGHDNESIESEDCLYLNIWAPCSKKQKAVMVWIYGGSFLVGSSSMTVYDGLKIAALGDIVFVSINYRLGVFGFSNSGTGDGSGNAGMYDQAEALKWIHDNIENFGGNSSCITLFGESAGSMSVSLHAVSPITSKLFHRAIMESGSLLLPIVPLLSTLNLGSTYAIAKAVGCTDLTNPVALPNAVIDCMRKKDAQTLNNLAKSYIFLPQYGDSFVPEDPRLLTVEGKSKNCNRLIGVTANEGSFLWTVVFKDIYGVFGEKVKHPTLKKSEARLMMSTVLTVSGIPPGASQLVIEHYLGKVQGDDNEEVLRQAYTAVGDVLLVCPTLYDAEEAARHKNNVYFYQFSHRTSFFGTPEWMGITHASEIPFVFGLPLAKDEVTSEVKFTEKEMDLSRKVITMWTNFAKTGSPNYGEMSWPLFSEEQPSYLVLNTTERFEIGQGPHQDNCDILKPIYGYLSKPNVTNLVKSSIVKDIPSLI